MNKSIHGGDRYRNKITLDFSVNVNPLGIPENIKKIYINLIDKLEYYPDLTNMNLRSKLAEKLKVPQNYLVFGNGASELLMAVVRTVKPKKIVLPVPSFVGYEHVLSGESCEVIYCPMNEEYSLDNTILEMLDEEVDLLFLTNPNNPTGRYVDNNLLTDILDRCKTYNIKVILDECFMELSDDCVKHTHIRHIDRWPNVLLIRAFTKTYAIPGIRLGYLICSDTQFISEIVKNIPEWNISVIAQELGEILLDEDDYIIRAVRLIKKEREYLTEELMKLDCKVVDSNTNFILFTNNKNATDWYNLLLDEGILVRECSNYKGIKDGFYRIAVRRHEDNKKLIRTMKQIITNTDK